MKYVATASVRIRIEFDSPEPDVPNSVSPQMIQYRDDEAIQAVDGVRINVGKHAEEMVPAAVQDAFADVGEVIDVMVDMVEEVDAS